MLDNIRFCLLVPHDYACHGSGRHDAPSQSLDPVNSAVAVVPVAVADGELSDGGVAIQLHFADLGHAGPVRGSGHEDLSACVLALLLSLGVSFFCGAAAAVTSAQGLVGLIG